MTTSTFRPGMSRDYEHERKRAELHERMRTIGASSARTRQARAAFKARLRAGEIDLVAVILGEHKLEPELAGMLVLKCLRAVPYVGDAKATAIMRSSRVNGRRPLRTLSRAERLRLAGELEERLSPVVLARLEATGARPPR